MGTSYMPRMVWINSCKVRACRQTKVLLLLALIMMGIWQFPEWSSGVIVYTRKRRSELFAAPTTQLHQPEPLHLEGTSKSHNVLPSKSSDCTPHHHIMFLKIHKCASSTVQNIFLRYGYQHNLTFHLGNDHVLPSHYLGNPEIFQYSMVNQDLLPPSGRADIFTLHTRLNIPEHKKAVYPDTKWITLVRHPVGQFESLYSYYNFKKLYKMDIEAFLKQSVEKLRKYPRKPTAGRQGKNTVLFDLGYPDMVSERELQQVIIQMENTFHLVMVAEKFDESLILMRHLLCWRLEDIVTFTKNARVKAAKDELSDQAKIKIEGMNREDLAIYKYYLLKHEKMVNNFGREEMAKEVKKLKNLRQEYFNICVEEEVKGHDKRLINKEWSKNVNAFLPSKNGSEACQLILMGEVPFVNLLKDRQKKMLSNP